MQETPRNTPIIYSTHPSVAINQSFKWIQFIDTFKWFFYVFFFLFHQRLFYSCRRHKFDESYRRLRCGAALNVQNIQWHLAWAQQANVPFIQTYIHPSVHPSIYKCIFIHFDGHGQSFIRFRRYADDAKRYRMQSNWSNKNHFIESYLKFVKINQLYLIYFVFGMKWNDEKSSRNLSIDSKLSAVSMWLNLFVSSCVLIWFASYCLPLFFFFVRLK